MRSSSTFAPLQAIQPLGLAVPPPDVITGSGRNDILSGTSGADTISGLAGDDNLYGNAGDDSLTGGKGRDNLSGDEGNDTLAGGAEPDHLEGGVGDDLLLGGASSDQLRGGDGDDRLIGGPGEDIAIYIFTSPVHFDGSRLNTAHETVLTDEFGHHDALIGVEGFEVIGSDGADTIVGSRGADEIATNGGVGDLVDAGAGNDNIDLLRGGDATVAAGSGADLIWINDSPAYWGDVAESHVSADGGLGSDRVYLSWFNSTTAETVSMTGGHLVGSTTDGLLTIDAIHVEALTIYSGLGDDSITGGAGDDNIQGSLRGGDDGDDTMAGQAGDDNLGGGGGDDLVIGGEGQDTMSGGDGADTFVFLSTQDSAKLSRADRITDLQGGDRIDLSAIDADTSQVGDQTFHLAAAFNHSAGELVMDYHPDSGKTLLRGDVDGDGKADFTIILDGDQTGFHGFVL